MDLRRELVGLEQSMAVGGDGFGADVVAEARRRIAGLENAFERMTGIAEDLGTMVERYRNMNSMLLDELRKQGYTTEQITALNEAV